VQIVPARPTDGAALSAIAWNAKAHWGYPGTWLEQWREHLTITPAFIAANPTFVALSKSAEAIGFSSLRQTGNALQLEHLWVLPAHMGRGLGRALFEHAARVAARTANSLTIESDPNAEGFYLRMGAVRLGTVSSEIDGRRRELPLFTFDLAPLRLSASKEKRRQPK
jgi:GNAT superfamily N-acetyltransferase